MMATTQPEDIPQTVRSRCQHFSFHAVKMADILKELRTIAEQEDVDADDTALNLLAEAGDGSMRDALSIMDQAIASAPAEAGRPRLDAAQIRELMGSVSNAVFERILDAVDEGRSAEVITVANELLDAGNSPSQLARQCVRYLRNCLMAKISGLSPDNVSSQGSIGELLQTSPDEQRRAARTAGRFSEEELTRFLQVMLRTFDELGYRQEQRFHFELGLLKLVHLRRLLPMEEVLSRLPQSPTPANIADRGQGARAALSMGRPPAPGSPASTPASGEAKAVFSPFQQDAARRVSPVSGAPTTSSLPTRPEAAVDTPPPNGSEISAQAQPGAVLSRSPRAQLPPAAVRHDADLVGSSKKIEPTLHTAVTTDVVASPELSVERLREAAAGALASAKSQGSASDAISDAEWTVANGILRIQTALSPAMLSVVVNAEAEKILRSALRDAGVGSLRIEIVPGAPRAQAEAKRPRQARSGSAQAKAEQHPIVQQAQRLFHAEIRNVIDLTEGK